MPCLIHYRLKAEIIVYIHRMYRIPLYTVHHKTTHAPFIFHIQSNDNAEYKPFLLGFDTKKSAYVMAKMLEGHKDKHKEWPVPELSPSSSFRIDANSGYEKNTLANLYIHEWKDTQMFNEFVTKSLLNVMVMHIGDDKRIRSNFFQYEYPVEHIRKNLRLD